MSITLLLFVSWMGTTNEEVQVIQISIQQTSSTFTSVNQQQKNINLQKLKRLSQVNYVSVCVYSWLKYKKSSKRILAVVLAIILFFMLLYTWMYVLSFRFFLWVRWGHILRNVWLYGSHTQTLFLFFLFFLNFVLMSRVNIYSSF